MKVRVHSVAVTQAPTEAKLPDGRSVQAMVDTLVVELVGERRTVTLDIPVDAQNHLDALRKRYVVGAEFTLTLNTTMGAPT